ncbi:17784_t:CDS:2 [Racocetra persica]|uniref:17784_t:CDS:1 n=1 Tax=Racocetra persica TaxID=160502 RepID=A0ACA9KXS3_9GLOM|nr:17784_t:CDS:2 [Racocetra persica]
MKTRKSLCEKSATLNETSANTEKQTASNQDIEESEKNFSEITSNIGEIEENSSEITSSPLKKQRLHKDKHIESYMNIDESDQEDQESNSDIETDNNDIIESRLTSPLPLNEEKLSNKRLLANNKKFEELNYNQQISQKPDELQEISSKFEAAAWLAKHSHILDLAFEIYNAISRTLENSQESLSKLKFLLSDRMSLITLTMIANLELEAKALFLRTRNNIPALYTELASAIYGISKVDKQMPALIKKCEILSQFLEATEQPALRSNKRIWNALSDFKTDMKVALRSCDAITVNLPIPTVLGIVVRLPVQDLLKYKTDQQRSK